MFVFLAAALSGCGTRRTTDLLEARLRLQEDRLAALETQLDSARSELLAQQRENETLRTRVASHSDSALLPEQADAVFRATGIAVHEWMTAGLDRDGLPGDDFLHAVIVPRDAHGEPVKVPGTVEMKLLDLSKPKDEQNLGTWTFDAEKSGRHWHAGALATGYLFELPWQMVPDSPKLLLYARLTTPDGRQFDTSAPVRVTPPEPRPRIAREEK
jgi:hypothetical protein